MSSGLLRFRMSREDCAVSLNEGSAHCTASTCTGEHSGRTLSFNAPAEARTHALEIVGSLLGQREVKNFQILGSTL